MLATAVDMRRMQGAKAWRSMTGLSRRRSVVLDPNVGDALAYAEAAFGGAPGIR